MKTVYMIDNRPWLDTDMLRAALGGNAEITFISDGAMYIRDDGITYDHLPVGEWSVRLIEEVLHYEDF